jgi:predicted transcriptional regulator
MLLRERSKLVFGNRDRLEVATAIARHADGWVNATKLAAELGIVNNRVRAQLVALTEAGLLEASPPDDRVRWYLRKESPFWDLCSALALDWGDEE